MFVWFLQILLTKENTIVNSKLNGSETVKGNATRHPFSRKNAKFSLNRQLSVFLMIHSLQIISRFENTVFYIRIT